MGDAMVCCRRSWFVAGVRSWFVAGEFGGERKKQVVGCKLGSVSCWWCVEGVSWGEWKLGV